MLAPARSHYRAQRKIATQAVLSARRMWRRMPPGGNWDHAWIGLSGALSTMVATAQRESAAMADDYTAAVLVELGMSTTAAGQVNAGMLAGVASDGRDLTTLLYGGVVAAGQAYNAGSAPTTALRQGMRWLDLAINTQVQDAGRVATEVASVARGAEGFIRMVSPGACSRCVVLAGRWYRYDAGFDRHPDCNCVGIPASEAIGSDHLVNPQAYFDHLSRAEQDRVFTKAGAEAIRLGADIGQVVNARRGMHTAAVNPRGWTPKGRMAPVDLYGHKVYTTTEGTTRHGHAFQALQRGGTVQSAEEFATRLTKRGPEQRRIHRTRARSPRLMPESILDLAESPEDAVRLLKAHGYLL